MWSDYIECKNKCWVVISCMEINLRCCLGLGLGLFTHCILQLLVRLNVKLSQKLNNVSKEFSLKWLSLKLPLNSASGGFFYTSNSHSSWIALNLSVASSVSSNSVRTTEQQTPLSFCHLLSWRYSPCECKSYLGSSLIGYIICWLTTD